MAGASAFRMVSITVGSMIDHRPMAAGGLALTMVPSGDTSVRDLKQPSLTGASGMVRHLNATRAAASPPEKPELSGVGTCGFMSE